jgi:acyl-CoA thioesterase-1
MLGRTKSWRKLCCIVGQMVAFLAVCNILAHSDMAARADDGSAPIRIVALGDSLTAGYMLPPADAFPVQLQAALRAKGHNVEVINAGVSGDTTTAGLERFDWSVPEKVDAAIVELGANDALRGIDPKQARASLDAILGKFKQRNVDVLLAGMYAPRNWGEDYRRTFDAIYPELSQQYGTLLYPFFLDGIVADAKLNQGDGLHPTKEGVAHIVARILPLAEDLVGRVKSRRAAGP